MRDIAIIMTQATKCHCWSPRLQTIESGLQWHTIQLDGSGCHRQTASGAEPSAIALVPGMAYDRRRGAEVDVAYVLDECIVVVWSDATSPKESPVAVLWLQGRDMVSACTKCTSVREACAGYCKTVEALNDREEVKRASGICSNADRVDGWGRGSLCRWRRTPDSGNNLGN